MKKEERAKTLSKNFYNDEILWVTDEGDIYLKEGVKRLGYPAEKQGEMSSINYERKAIEKKEAFEEAHGREETYIFED